MSDTEPALANNAPPPAAQRARVSRLAVLQLARNVRAALLALQLAEARLSRADRPQFAPIRRALARDIERLKAAPAIDFPALAMRLDNLIASVDALPLAFEERAERTQKETPSPGGRGCFARSGTA